uniref:Uncharacterized protein n=1 Tax=Panagrolaimus superbus TaxID=310955 RepID=A0A914YNJ6_9BILA
MFPLGKSDCDKPKRIRKLASVGYVHGCAEHFLLKSFLKNFPVSNFEKLCFPPNEHALSYSLKIKNHYCRCKEEMCNNPEKDFVNADYVAPPSSQISSGSEVHLPGTALTSSATTASSSFFSSSSKTVTLATTVIGTNALTISLSSNHQADPLKFILSNLIAFLIYQMF